MCSVITDIVDVFQWDDTKNMFFDEHGILNATNFSLQWYFKKATTLGHFWPTYASVG